MEAMKETPIGDGGEDPRISQYVDATLALARGEFRPEVAPARDGLGRLGDALRVLGQVLESRFDEASRLAQLMEQVNRGLLLEETLDYLYDSFRPLLPYDRIGCSLVTPGADTVRAIWARSDRPSEHLPIGYEAPLQGSSLLEILRTGRPRILNDLVAYLRDHPDSESTRRIVLEGVRSSLTCPLQVLGRPVGFLFFSSTKPFAYADMDVSVFMKVAGQISAMIDKSRLYQDLLRARQELLDANKKLAEIALRDGLTGILNRRAFEDRLADEWRRAQRNRRSLGLIIGDLDFFKQLNDALGHLVGDDVLRTTARVLAEELKRSGEFVARYGGEEFAIVVPDADDAALAALGARLLAALARQELPHPRSPLGPHLTITLGGASLVPELEQSPLELVARADGALLEAKGRGRNRYLVASELREASGPSGSTAGRVGPRA
jgi:diguanylate cyclase (GGDEF)-like protein